ncbi:EAL domain-containing protein [Hydrogenimonas sp. SS33]|uniref:EAL domain-containing protein n=1 Tax=Hydrogenimonas leucolamina TaxID=2954236 RepID=UPI00336BAF41
MSLLFELVGAYYLKQEALTRLAMDDARKTSQLVFETLYTKMQEGWSRQDIDKILERLNTVRSDMKVRVVRSPLVEKLFGAVPGDHERISKNPVLRQALEGNESMRVDRNGNIHYFYPVRVEKRCLHCHTNAMVGDVNGVIEVEMPAKDIVVSLDRIIFYFLSSLGFFLLLFFFFFYWAFDIKLVKPLVALTKRISSIDPEHPGGSIEVQSRCRELKTLEKTFNRLMEQIHFYYDRLVNSYTTDPLTGLKNMNALKKDLEEGRPFSMLLLNIDRFRELNDYYGFAMGDRVLKAVAAYLKEKVGKTMRLYRIGGSEFAVVCASPFDPRTVSSLLEEIHTLPAREASLSEIRISMTAGVVQHQRERLFEKASIALSAAKSRQIPFEFYRNAEEVEKAYKQHIHWMKRVEKALDEGRVTVHYQPIQQVRTKATDKYEALVRIVEEDGSLHLPGEFLDVVYNSSLYARLTREVVRKSFECFRHVPCSFSVNLSINDISDPACRNYIYEALRTYPEPGRVIFEILESEKVSNFTLANEFIGTIHRLGAKIAIDDFGNGYSNFNYLLRMDVDFYKIDASLIRNVVEDPNSRLLVESIVHFAKRLGVETVAEYVASREIADVCIELGVDYLQGYYIGKPTPDPLCNGRSICPEEP